jgi:hypothetical protein
MTTLPGIDWDCGRIPSTYSNPEHDLPQFILVRVKEEANPMFVIIKTSFVHRTDHPAAASTKFWKLKVLDNPFLLIRGGEEWFENGTIIAPHKYYIERDATEVRPLGIYSTSVKRTSNYMIMPHLNFSDRVYEYTFTYPKNCLPPKYIYVFNEKDVNECYHFRGGYNMCKFRPAPAPSPVPAPVPPTPVPPTPVPQPIQSRIPQFVFQAYVTAAAEKKEECPITLEPITKETVGAAPCGHLFNKEALKKELERSGRCPTCRAAAKPTEIQIW